MIYQAILHKIRAALKERDDVYKLKEIIELDGDCLVDAIRVAKLTF